MLRAYPRARGGNSTASVAARFIRGLSPRTRGKPSSAWTNFICQRPIPAHAGETLYPGLTSSPVAAYPRARGGNIDLTAGIMNNAGLSPRTRGKLSAGRPADRGMGPIPAHAGETQPPNATPPAARAYPRARGGNLILKPARSGGGGLSPRTRGKLFAGRRIIPWLGPIPAHAGETRKTVPAHCGQRAYPRARGGNDCWRHMVFREGGPSPRTRGKL